ncbi:hypothetical protein PRUPE_2G280700 [Prunus persica]|uniref:Uncharacterized protein n=1 Tax=Prunus persica TaxID=3760 RepID=A0A251QNT4_PRUPE|nr:hypothetical protein PRUPE_2G280700 [Prunus persica]
MGLQIHSPSSFTSKPYHHLPHTPLLHFSVRTQFTVKLQTPSEPSKPKAETTQASPKKPTSAGLGFGSSPSSPTTQNVTSVPNKKKRVIRRSPVEKPLLYSEEDEAKAKEMGTNESAFVLAWLGLGGVILAQGLLLAASVTNALTINKRPIPLAQIFHSDCFGPKRNEASCQKNGTSSL